ncbi:NLP/P60 hydrolase [Rhodosalinus halophilus]|uniref:NLP/P60 hydrolase n=1 Tax=Rhodosalinus halophilus TaxID=2259333 RepID=A0A365UB54_9RHOB|nr:NlpC/P60 family protein [Rhodosalinus halophilus]RBI85527.1 NLP/P60 hydrolase [Rhodosalinus halophilus]
MTDRRLTPANGRVAAAHLKGRLAAERFVEGEAAGVAAPLADLLAAPEGARDRQLLLGEAVTVYERCGGWAFVQAAKDGYVGYLLEKALGPPVAATHRVAARATHVYPAPDMKRRERMALSLGARLAVTGTDGRFSETPLGFVPRAHLAPAELSENDPVSVAERFMGTPYLWGGNSAFGIDCSGLVQAALLACGIACPGDTDMQESLGTAAQGPPRRGDLLFWKGHVALVRDAETLVHANAHHMAVTIEGIAEAIDRIAAQGEGPVTAHRRL